MTTNDIWTFSPDMLGNGNSNCFFNYQTQSNEGAEFADYIRITDNFDSSVINRLLEGKAFLYDYNLHSRNL